MLSTRWEPFAQMNRLRSEMDRLMGRLGISQSSYGADVFPALNIWEDDNQLFVESEIPGCEMNELEIYVTGGNQLSIRGERKRPVTSGGSWHRQERGFGAFSRMIELPCSVESDKVTAEFKHGVLTLTLPKSEEVKPRRIEVKSG